MIEKKPVKIIVDKQEKSEIPILLERLGAELEFDTLITGDYVVSDDSAFEYKSIVDFLESEVGDEKLKVNRQVRTLVDSYNKPALLIGGSLLELLTARNIHVNSVMAFIQSIMWSGCAVRFLNTPEITANYIYAVAKKEQHGEGAVYSAHGRKTKRTLSEQQAHIVSSIPDIGAIMATDLLLKLGSVESITTATIPELMEIKGIGEPTAKHIRHVVGSAYK